MNIGSQDTPLVVLCPAWKKWGTATKVKANTTILHSRQDDVVPLVVGFIKQVAESASLLGLFDMAWEFPSVEPVDRLRD